MVYFAAFANRSARWVLLTHAMAVLVVGTAAAVAVCLAPTTGWQVGCAILVSGPFLVASSWAMSRFLSDSAGWERLLARIEHDDPNSFSLPRAAGASPAAHGWNRLVSAGRRWQALSDLERGLVERLQTGTADVADVLIDALADGMVAVDLAGKISTANAVFVAMCGGASREAVLGQPLATVLGVTPDDERLVDQPAHALLAFDWRLPAAEGTERLLRCTRRPWRDVSGDLAGYVWTIRDVTQQRLSESLREKFLSAAAHELRTPLANIRAYAEALGMSNDIDVESRKRFYNIIQCESVRLAQLVDDLLDISRMQAGALSLDRYETDLGRLVEEASAKVQAQMQEKQLTFTCVFPPKFPKACVDKGKLCSVLVNLLGNAAKYTPPGGRVIFRVDFAPEQIQFSVTDTGVGISPEELPLVFDRFFRSADERVRETSGSGLGLAIAQEIARLHGGEVTAESVLNKGSTFRLSIPLDPGT